MLRIAVLALALLVGSAVADDLVVEEACPYAYDYVMPKAQVCSMANTNCWVEHGKWLDTNFPGDCGETLCETVVPDFCTGWCYSGVTSISSLQADGKTYKDVPISSLKIGDKVESRGADKKPVAAEVRKINITNPAQCT